MSSNEGLHIAPTLAFHPPRIQERFKLFPKEDSKMAVLKMGGGMGMHPNRLFRCFMLLLSGFLVYYFTVRFAHLVIRSNEHRPHGTKSNIQGTMSWQNDMPGKQIAEVRVMAAEPKVAPSYKSVSNISSDPKVFSGRNIHRIVHLDLKGAPPNIEYLRKIIPRFREWGATGLLIEYEDMFPYWGSLNILARSDAYNASTVAEILRLAEENGLIVIPLIQTFGHFEFVLKHSQFSHIREVENRLNNLNPAHKDSFGVVKQMIDQMLSRHPNVKYLHIGCDEVFYLGFSRESMAMMRDTFVDEKGLFVYHVMRILNYIRDTYPRVKPIMWDDMIRKMDGFQLKRNNFANLVEPMVWLYVPHVERQFHTSFWDNYAEVFPNVWTASAFKGATGKDQYVVDIQYHLRNHENWLKVMEKTHSRHYPSMKFRGIALTGWQRYDHTLPLCELLPVGIPSLLACLHCITHNGFSPEVHKLVSDTLKCNIKLNLSPAKVSTEHARCHFPGSDIYDAVAELKMTRIHIDKYLRWRAHDNDAGELIRKRILSHLHSMPPILLTVLDKEAVKEFMQDQVIMGVSRLPDVRREAQTTLFQVYPWMRPQGQIWVFLVYATLSCLCFFILIYLTLRLRRLQIQGTTSPLVTSPLPRPPSHVQFSYKFHSWA